jgi:hypothetical protein
VQFALGVSFPTPGTFYSTGGQPKFKPDKDTAVNTNEPYMTVCMHPLHCLILQLHELRASGWTLSLNKKRFLRPSQPVMVTMSKQVSFTFRLFCRFQFTEGVDGRCSTRRLCASRMPGFCSTRCVTLPYAILKSSIVVPTLSLGARGTSVLFSSGDGGVGDGNPDFITQTCITNDGKNRTRFIPTFPATCPL